MFGSSEAALPPGVAAGSSTECSQALLLSGPPRLVGPGFSLPLKLKYRKGLAVLAYLGWNVDQVIPRTMLADLLWPDLDRSSARGNLRVVLADLVGVLRAVGLTEQFQVERDWLCLRSTGGLITDRGAFLGVMAAGAVPARHQDWLRQELVLPQEWLQGMESGTSEDFDEWVSAQRRTLDSWRVQLSNSLPGLVPSLPQAEACELVWLALLHFEADVDPGAASGSVREPHDHAALQTEMGSFGGCLLAGDGTHGLVAFGLDSHHPGFRWQAWRAAAHLGLRRTGGQALRMGLCVGHVLLQRSPGGGAMVSGPRVRLVQRLAWCVDPGQVACDASMRDMVHGVALQSVGPQRFRGWTQTVDVWSCTPQQVLRALSPGPVGGLAQPLIGRQTELAAGLRQVEACRGPLGIGMVTVVSPGGLGKSRLAWEAARAVLQLGGTVWWVTARPETQYVAWRGLANALRGVFAGADPLAQRLLRLRPDEGGWPEAEVQALDALLQGAVPARQRRALESGLVRLISGGGVTQFALCVVDDVHWLDAASAETLVRVARDARRVCWWQTWRPDEKAAVDLSAVLPEGVNGALLSLKPLSDTQSRELLQAMPDTEGLDANELAERARHARGIPLYLLADARLGSADPGGELGELWQSVTNRLGRTDLKPLRLAALLGQSFDTADIEAVCGPGSDAVMTQAEASGVLLPADIDRHWSFAHPRLREQALGSLTVFQRRGLAAQAAQLKVEQGMWAAAASLWGLADEPAQARNAWQTVARQATAAGDLLAALMAYGRLADLGYLEGVAGLEQRASHVRTACAVYGYGATEVVHLAAQTVVHAQTLADHPDAAFGLLSMKYVVGIAQHQRLGLPHVRQMFGIAQTPQQRFHAQGLLATCTFVLGLFDEASPHFVQSIETGLDLHVRDRVRYFPSDMLVFLLVQWSWLQWLRGDPAWSDTMALAHDRVMQAAQHRTGLQDACIAHAYHATLCWTSSQFSEQEKHARKAQELAASQNLKLWQSMAGLQLMLAQARQGQAVGSEQIMALAQGIARADRGYAVPAWMFAADTLLALKEAGPALHCVEQGLLLCADEHLDCRMDLFRVASGVHALMDHQPAAAHARAQAIAAAKEARANGWLACWAEALTPHP